MKSLLGLLGLLCLLRLFCLLRFLSHSILSGFNGLKRDTEACLAEGQPRNILGCNPNRFGARCPALSPCCHRVIHSCYAFFRIFSHATRSAPQKSARVANDRASRTACLGLTMAQRDGAFCLVPEPRASSRRSSSIQNHTADCAIASESPLSGVAASCPPSN